MPEPKCQNSPRASRSGPGSISGESERDAFERALKVLFMGSGDFAAPIFDAVAATHRVLAVVTQPDRPAGRGRRMRPPAVKERALALGTPVLQPTRLKTRELRETLSSFEVDVFVVAAYGRILPPEILAIPPRGCWNLHGSLLPAWRGAAPIQWSIMAGDRETGVTVMRMDEGMDTGDIALQRRTLISEDDTAGHLSTRLSHLGAEALVEALGLLAEDRLRTRPQDPNLASVAPILRKEDGRLSFQEPGPRVACHARGVDPWPGAHARLRRAGENERPERELPVLKLFGARAVAEASGTPGRVLDLTGDGLLVACGEGAISFAEAQLPGRKRLFAAELLTGRALGRGDSLC